MKETVNSENLKPNNLLPKGVILMDNASAASDTEELKWKHSIFVVDFSANVTSVAQVMVQDIIGSINTEKKFIVHMLGTFDVYKYMSTELIINNLCS